MVSSAIPRADAAMTDAGGRLTRPWYAWFQTLNQSASAATDNLQSEIVTIARVLGSHDGTVENIPSSSAGAGQVISHDSIVSQGRLPGIVDLALQNDSAAPGNVFAYGTNATGLKGWYPISAALSSVPTNVTLAVGSDGITTIDLAPLDDVGGGTLLRVVRDAWGRLSGTSAATTSDLTEGANLYFTDARAAAAAPIQSIVAGTNVTVDSTDPRNPIVNASGSGGNTTLHFPFLLSDGTSAPIALTADQKLPFFLSNGTAANIAMTT